jgi:16S rRNA U1498 N3-methylase RsmE
MTDEAVVLSLPKMHKEEIETQKDTEVGEEVKEISSSRVSNKESAHVVISLGPKSSWSINDRPKVDLVLALPRPLRLERLLPVISCMGVGRLVLIGASKVEKGYFGKHSRTFDGAQIFML